MRKSMLVLGVVMSALVGVFSAKAEETNSANYWMAVCKSGNPTKHLVCMAYLKGMIDGNMNSGGIWFCPPPGATYDQSFAIIIEDLERQPENWHEDFVVLATVALAKVFRCPHPGEINFRK